jgi:hypothetical protein
MTAIDLLCDHWAETRNKRSSHTLQLKGDRTLTIYWRPWTIDERDFVVEGFDPVAESRMFRPSRFKRAFFIKAENEDGSRMFVTTDMLMLGSRVDPAVIATVGGLMLADLNAANAVGAAEGEGGDAPKA